MIEVTDVQKVRAKVAVSSIDMESGSVVFRFVYSADPNHENHAFWEATPSGTLVLHLSKTAGGAALAYFAMALRQDRELYLDFIAAPK